MLIVALEKAADWLRGEPFGIIGGSPSVEHRSFGGVMEREWIGETAWAAIFGLTAVAGVLALVSDGSADDVRGWIEALGGWAAAIVVVPTIILLRSQTRSADVQASLARRPALEAQIEMMKDEGRFVSVIAEQLSRLDLDYEFTLIGVSELTAQRMYVDIKTKIDVGNTIITKINAMLNDRSIEKPSLAFRGERANVSAALGESQARLVRLRSIARDADYESPDLWKKVDALADAYSDAIKMPLGVVSQWRIKAIKLIADTHAKIEVIDSVR